MAEPSYWGAVSVTALVAGTLALTGTLFPLQSQDPDSLPPTAPDTSQESVNALTEAERAAGWRLLFDGTSFDGWRGYRSDSMPSSWTIEQGALHLRWDTSASATIVTTERYDHFELRLEWRIAAGGNSGIMYRVTEAAEAPYRTGPEYQLLDNRVLDDAGEPRRQAGSLYGLYAPSEDVTRPVGQYNRARIVVRGDHVEHWLNGKKLLEAEIGSDRWENRVAGTKFAEYPAFAEAKTGYIALQDHGHRVWFRDIKLRPLGPNQQ